MQRLLALALVIFISLEASAILKSDLTAFDESLYLPAQERNPSLLKKVDFAFKDTKLSDILLLLSKVGEFNVVLPEQYDRNMTVTITKQRVIDAIEDISDLTRLSYQFKGNSLIMTQADIDGRNFISIPVLHYKAKEIAQGLNENLFKQLEISQAEASSKAYASADPTKNSVIVLGNQEQIDAAKSFVKVLDSPPKVKIYTPSYIHLQEAKKLLRAHFDRNSTIRIKHFEKNSFLLKGDAKELSRAVELIEDVDKEPQPVALQMSVYSVAKDRLGLFKQVNSAISYGRLQRFLAREFEANAQKDIYKYLEKKDSFDILLKKNQELDVMGIKLSARQSLVDKEQFALNTFGDSIHLGKRDLAFYLLDDHKLNDMKELKKLATKGQAAELLLVFKGV